MVPEAGAKFKVESCRGIADSSAPPTIENFPNLRLPARAPTLTIEASSSLKLPLTRHERIYGRNRSIGGFDWLGGGAGGEYHAARRRLQGTHFVGAGCLFIPIVPIIFIIINWDKSKNAFFTWIAGVLLVFLGVLLGGTAYPHMH
jgi:hypothetical protein